LGVGLLFFVLNYFWLFFHFKGVVNCEILLFLEDVDKERDLSERFFNFKELICRSWIDILTAFLASHIS
jgi:hypothetical protein